MPAICTYQKNLLNALTAVVINKISFSLTNTYRLYRPHSFRHTGQKVIEGRLSHFGAGGQDLLSYLSLDNGWGFLFLFSDFRRKGLQLHLCHTVCLWFCCSLNAWHSTLPTCRQGASNAGGMGCDVEHDWSENSLEVFNQEIFSRKLCVLSLNLNSERMNQAQSFFPSFIRLKSFS